MSVNLWRRLKSGGTVSEPNASPKPGRASAEGNDHEDEDEDEFDQIKNAWKWLGIVLAIFAYGGLGYIQHVLQPYFSVWQILWVTLPLGVTVAIVVFLEFRGVKVTGGAFFAILLGAFLAGALTGLTSGTSVFDYLYHRPGPCDLANIGNPNAPCNQSGFNQNENIFWAILSGYVHIYGILGFIRSVLVGGFVGFSAAALVTRAERMTKRKKAAGRKARDAKAAGSST
jgi:amino acid transporter